MHTNSNEAVLIPRGPAPSMIVRNVMTNSSVELSPLDIDPILLHRHTQIFHR